MHQLLNKTNVHANVYDLASTVVDSDKRKENLATVAKNTLMMRFKKICQELIV